MTKSKIMIGLAGLALLTACGSDQEDIAVEDSAQESVEEVDETAFIDASGRWSTQAESVSGENRLVVDIAANGDFTIDVRTLGTNAEAIVESGKGKATRQGHLIMGTINDGPGIHDILEDYSRWTINTDINSITGSGAATVSISRE